MDTETTHVARCVTVCAFENGVQGTYVLKPPAQILEAAG